MNIFIKIVIGWIALQIFGVIPLLFIIGISLASQNKKSKPYIIEKSNGKFSCNSTNKSYIDKNGYRRFSDSDKLIHRYVMEKVLGRKLYRWEVVHHIDGFKRNNRPSNLIVCSAEKHDMIHRNNLAKFGTWHHPLYN